MTYYPHLHRPSAEAIDVQLHYDPMSGIAYACSSIFQGVLPSRYRSREAAEDAARNAIGAVANSHPDTAMQHIRIWLR